MTSSAQHSRGWRLRYLAGGVATLTFGLAACGSGGSTPAAAVQGQSLPVSTTIDPSKPVTITVADGWGKTGTGVAFGEVIANFEKLYPNVKIIRQTTDYSTYQQSIDIRATAPNPPDVMMLETSGYGQGFYNLARAGLLLPLDSYAKAYNWQARFGAPSTLDVFRFDRANNSQWGSGALYGLPEQNSMIGLYYNSSLLRSIGLSAPPTTFAGFESSLAAAKQHGITGIEESDTYIHTEMALWDAFASSAVSVNNWIFGNSGSFQAPENVKAAQTIADWQKAGYFEPGAAGTSDSTAAANFLSGKALYYIEGSWLTGGVQSSLGKNGGLTVLPSESASSPVGGGPSTPLVISSKSKYPTVDAAFLNYFISPQTSAFLADNGWGVPGALVPSSGSSTSSLTDTASTFLSKIESASGPGTTPFLDWAAPQFTSELPADLQDLASGNTSPASYTSKIQTEWQQFQQQRHS